MKGSSEKEMAVYEFDDDEMAVEAESSKYTARFQTQNALDKYTFLQTLSSVADKKQINAGVCINIHEMDDMVPSYGAHLPEEDISCSAQRSQFNGLMEFTTNYNQHLTSQEMKANMVPDGENDSWRSLSEPSSSPCSDETENNGYFERQACDDEYCPSSYTEAIIKEGQIILWPDYVTCGRIVYVEPIFTFSSDGIKIEGKDCEDQDYSIEWCINDILHIGCKWSASAQGASMKIVLRHETRFIKLFTIFSDMRWQEKEHMIKNLSSRYTEIWNSVLLDDIASDDDRMDSALFFPKHYFSGIAENFEDVIYPKGDPDAVSISKRDIDLLLPETFINDTIIDFYIKYLNNNIPEMKKQRLHFFNSFFFRKLADLDKDQGKTPEGRAAFLRVRKWTRKFNIFDKDFIFIPVNFNLHWSLLIICHPGETVKGEEEDTRESEKVPCILHLDSLRGNHNGLKNIIQSYLWEEWKERNPNSTEDNSSKFVNLRFVSLELPQQDNCFDCGLFLLHYVELFLEDAPFHLNPFKITKYSNFLTPDWFPPADASHKRSVIRKLIYDLLYETCTNGFPQKNGMKLDREEAVIELLSQPFCPSEPILASVCPVNETGNGDDSEIERIQKQVSENASECLPENVEPETCILEDDEEEKQVVACTSVSAEMDEADENPNSQSQTSQCQVSPKQLDTETPDSVQEKDDLLDDSSEKDEEEKEKLLEDSSEKDEQAEVPASPQPDISSYVPDTPIISLNETINKENVKRGEKSTIGENIGYELVTPVISSDDDEKSNVLQNAVVPNTPIVDSSVGVLEIPVVSEKEGEKEKLGKCVLSEADNCGEIVLETPVVSGDNVEQNKEGHDGMEIEKEEFVRITVQLESSKDESFRVSSEDIVISDDEGSVSTEQTPRKKRRKVVDVLEGSRRLTRSAIKGSAR